MNIYNDEQGYASMYTKICPRYTPGWLCHTSVCGLYSDLNGLRQAAQGCWVQEQYSWGAALWQSLGQPGNEHHYVFEI